MAITFPWTRGTEAARAANSTVPAAGMLAVTSEGNVYAADGSTAWNAAQRLAKASEVAAAQTAATTAAASDAANKVAAEATARNTAIAAAIAALPAGAGYDGGTY